jgi:hypothetical protein
MSSVLLSPVLLSPSVLEIDASIGRLLRSIASAIVTSSRSLLLRGISGCVVYSVLFNTPPVSVPVLLQLVLQLPLSVSILFCTSVLSGIVDLLSIFFDSSPALVSYSVTFSLRIALAIFQRIMLLVRFL